MRTSLLVLLAAYAAGLSAQDKISLMNGQELTGKVIAQSTLEIRYLVPRKNRSVERSIPTTSVFSVTDSVGRERMWYFQDTIFGNTYSIPEMRWYIKGERDARDGYRPLGPMIGGFVLGAGAVIALDLETSALAIPPIYGGIMAWPRVYVTRGSISDPHMEGDPIYATGYSAAGRPKRVFKSMLSSAIGVVVGLAVRRFIINPGLEPEH